MNRIRELRVAAGWRQVDLADRLHIKKNTVCRYERESLGIDATMIHALCDLFDCSADYLLCRSAVRKSTFTDEECRRHRLTPHSCRHTFATLLKRAHGSDADKLALIGHTSTDQLRDYQDVPVEDLRRIIDQI